MKTKWDSGTLIFNLFIAPKFGNNGVIDYPLCRVDCDAFLHYETKGSDSDGCSYNGSGDYVGFSEFDHIRLSFGRGFANYYAQDFVDWVHFSYEVTVACPGTRSRSTTSPTSAAATGSTPVPTSSASPIRG